MMRLFKTMLGVAGLLVATGATAQYSEPMYHITYYSDASQTEEVGYAVPGCGPSGVTYEYYGERTPFSREDLFARCTASGPEIVS